MSQASALFGICNANAGVLALLKTGSGPLRLFPAGNASQEQARPYATFQTVGGHVENSMDSPSRADNGRIQIDAWAENDADGAEAIALALRTALEDPAAQLAAGVTVRTLTPIATNFEAETMLNRASFDVSLWSTN